MAMGIWLIGDKVKPTKPRTFAHLRRRSSMSSHFPPGSPHTLRVSPPTRTLNTHTNPTATRIIILFYLMQ